MIELDNIKPSAESRAKIAASILNDVLCDEETMALLPIHSLQMIEDAIAFLCDGLCIKCHYRPKFKKDGRTFNLCSTCGIDSLEKCVGVVREHFASRIRNKP